MQYVSRVFAKKYVTHLATNITEECSFRASAVVEYHDYGYYIFAKRPRYVAVVLLKTRFPEDARTRALEPTCRRYVVVGASQIRVLLSASVSAMAVTRGVRQSRTNNLIRKIEGTRARVKNE